MVKFDRIDIKYGDLKDSLSRYIDPDTSVLNLCKLSDYFYVEESLDNDGDGSSNILELHFEIKLGDNL